MAKFIEQSMHRESYSIRLQRSPYGTYVIYLIPPSGKLELIEEDTSQARITAVWEFLRRKPEIAWKACSED